MIEFSKIKEVFGKHFFDFACECRSSKYSRMLLVKADRAFSLEHVVYVVVWKGLVIKVGETGRTFSERYSDYIQKPNSPLMKALEQVGSGKIEVYVHQVPYATHRLGNKNFYIYEDTKQYEQIILDKVLELSDNELPLGNPVKY